MPYRADDRAYLKLRNDIYSSLSSENELSEKELLISILNNQIKDIFSRKRFNEPTPSTNIKKLDRGIISSRIKEICKESFDGNMKAFSSSINIALQNLYKYTNGHTPDINGIYKIATIGKVSIDWLCGLSDFRTCNVSTYDELLPFLNIMFNTSYRIDNDSTCYIIPLELFSHNLKNDKIIKDFLLSFVNDYNNFESIDYNSYKIQLDSLNCSYYNDHTSNINDTNTATKLADNVIETMLKFKENIKKTSNGLLFDQQFQSIEFDVDSTSPESPIDYNPFDLFDDLIDKNSN